ncbi:MAG: hypothetical protein JXB29_02400 [Sedimentisphaerales bacterium]|nr:hypothetical protein [Sedimentisphaerales bacterium]
MSPALTESEVVNSLSSESYHPYGNCPESHAWDPECLEDNVLDDVWGGSLEGRNQTSNIKWARKKLLMNIQDYGWGFEQNITEIGAATSNQQVKARFAMRAYLIHHALGFKRVNFYELASSPSGLGFVDENSQTPLIPYTAIKTFMKDISGISVFPVESEPLELPSVIEYNGSYPLTAVPIIGRSSILETKNSVLFVTWQRTWTTGSWVTMSSPPAASATIQLPDGFIARRAWNLITREDVPITQDGNNVVYNIADDPVMLQIHYECLEADLYKDNTINFNDYSILSRNWLE